jgi:hypothetical protein
LALLRTDFPIFPIALISYNDFAHVFLGMLVDLSHPVLDVHKTCFAGDVVDQYNTTCAVVECACDLSVTLLASSIPDLHFHLGFVKLNDFHFEVYTDSGYVVLRERFFTVL